MLDTLAACVELLADWEINGFKVRLKQREVLPRKPRQDAV